ncbi:MAG: cysteine desulfurase NifS [Bradymonadales bacterium]|jgi:cysteine desulfurase
MTKTIYLDNNATTWVPPQVVDAMLPYFSQFYFNPSSMYDSAKAPAAALKQARDTIAHFIDAPQSSEILFTSCATESNSSAIRGAAMANPRRKHIVTTQVEHPAVLELCHEMQRQGYSVDYIPVDTKGQLDLRAFVRALRPKETLIVSIMHANNETGVIFDIERLANITKRSDPQILFHTDATQSVGKLPISMRTTFKDVDFLSFSGHKIHAPKGVGALYIRKGAACRPYLVGGHQELGRRGGTENIPYIVAMAKACELAQSYLGAEGRVAELRDRLEAGLKRIPHVVVNGEGAERLPNTTNIACHYIEGEGILYQLDMAGICASSGSACTSGSLEPSHVLRAMKVPFTAIHGSIRFSLSRYTTQAEVDHVIELMPQIVARLRKLSPYWDSQNDVPKNEGLIIET